MFVLASVLQAQDSTKSEAFKKNPFFHPPLFKPKYNSYPLVAGYLLMKDAKSGDPFAEHELGLRYLLGRGFPKDTAKAVFWIRKAAKHNLTTAKFNYGIMLMNGIGVEWNPFKAFKNFEFAAKAGMPEAEYVYATFYLDNLVVNRNYSVAFKWLEKAAEHKLKQAEKLLERMKESGIEVATNADTSSESSKGGNVQSLNYSYNPKTELLNSNWELSYFNFENDSTKRSKGKKLETLLKKNSKELIDKLGLGEYDSVKIKEEPLKLIKETASYGSPNAFKFLGKFYEYGIEVPQDTVKAVLNYLRALRLGAAEIYSEIIKLSQSAGFFDKLKKLADAGNGDAEYIWAALAALNFSFQITKEQAFELLRKAADNGNIPALIELGLAYFNGAAVEKNPTKAQEYWHKAAKLGNREAEVRIAFASILYSSKRKNFKKEITVLKNAAAQGSTPAINALAYFYEKGIVVRKNKAEAARYYRRAYYLGDRKAYDNLRALYDEIRPADKIFKIYDSDL